MITVPAMLRLDNIPKTIDDCTLTSGDRTTIKFGKGLAWGTIVT